MMGLNMETHIHFINLVSFAFSFSEFLDSFLSSIPESLSLPVYHGLLSGRYIISLTKLYRLQYHFP